VLNATVLGFIAEPDNPTVAAAPEAPGAAIVTVGGSSGS